MLLLLWLLLDAALVDTPDVAAAVNEDESLVEGE